MITNLLLQITKGGDMETMERNNIGHKESEAIYYTEFLPHIDALYNYAYRLTGKEDDAKDLLQDVCMRSFRYINSYQPGTNAKAWLFKMMNNHFINDYRKQSKLPTHIEYDKLSYMIEPKYADKNVLFTTLSDEVSSALNALPAHLKSIVVLCDLEDFKYDEIASIMNIPIGTVKSWLHKARTLLKESLEHYYKARLQ